MIFAVVQLIQGWINPFSESQDLVSISTAMISPQDISSDLLNAHSIGEKCYLTFRSDRLEKDVPCVKFYDTQPANKLKTFSNLLCKKKPVMSSGRTIILEADRSLFGRIIVMAQGSRWTAKKDQQSFFSNQPLEGCGGCRRTP